MTVIIFALLAAVTPTAHTSAQPATAVHQTSSPRATPHPSTSPKRSSASTTTEDENKRIADATVALANTTFYLALATAAAVIAPLIASAVQTARRRKVALGQLSHIVYFFKDRTGFLNEFPEEDARALLNGLDTALTRALADDIGDALSRNDADICYNALFSAHGAISRAISQQQQAREDPLASGTVEASIKEDTSVAIKDIEKAQKRLRELLGHS